MVENNKKEITEAQLSSFKGRTETRKFVSNTVIIIIVLLFIALIFLVSKFGENFFIFFMFVIILLFPIFLIFKSQFLELLPSYLKDTLTSLDEEEQRKTVDINVRIPNIVKEILTYGMAGLFLLGGGVMMYFIKKELQEKVDFMNDKDIELSENSKKRSKKILIKFIGAFISIIIGGVITLDAK